MIFKPTGKVTLDEWIFTLWMKRPTKDELVR
jgi:hypothetical protein